MTVTNLQNPIRFNYHINNILLSTPDTIKDLGVTFTNKWNFCKHINSIVNSSFQTLGFLKRHTQDFRTKRALLLLYTTMVRSKLEYASVVWSHRQEYLRSAIERVQRKALKYICYQTRVDNTSYTYFELCSLFGLQSLQRRRITADFKTIHKIYHDLIKVTSIKESVQNYISAYNIRNPDIYVIPTSRLDLHKESFLIRTLTTANRSCISLNQPLSSIINKIHNLSE